MQNQSTSPGLARRVKTLVRQKLAEGRAAQKVIASELGLEIRTLQRELKAKGTSFRKLLIDVRKELAIQLLSRGKHGDSFFTFCWPSLSFLMTCLLML